MKQKKMKRGEKMQKVREIITIDNSLFSAIKNEYNELYNSLFGSNEPDDMDNNLLITCGERYASNLLIHYDMNKVAKFIVSKYGDNWEKIKKALYADYDITKPYNVKQTTTSEKTATNKNTGESTDKSSIVGFDSESATDSNIDMNTNSNTINESERTAITIENVGNNGTINNASLVKSEVELRKISLQSLILNDIQSQITLDIY